MEIAYKYKCTRCNKSPNKGVVVKYEKNSEITIHCDFCPGKEIVSMELIKKKGEEIKNGKR